MDENENGHDPAASGDEALESIGNSMDLQGGHASHADGAADAVNAAHDHATGTHPHIEHVEEAIEHGVEKLAAEEMTRQDHVIEWVAHHINPNPHKGEAWHLFPGIGVPLPDFINVHYVMLGLAVVFLLLAFLVFYKHTRVPRGAFTNFLEVLVKFIRDDICIPNFGQSDGRKMTPLFATFFFFILTMNVMGLIPIFSTATGNLAVTGGLATVVFTIMVIGGMMVHNPIGWLKAFMPHGVPIPVLFIITPLELIGLAVKSFALAMRLFANMLAGHIVLFSFIGMSVAFGAIGAPSILLAIGVYALEVFVAFLQAYVFTLLSAIFVGHVFHPDH